MTCTCTHRALSHRYDTTARANTGECLVGGCGCAGESGGKALGIRGKLAVECDNNGTAKGRIALTNPTLLATVSTTAKGA